MTETDCHLTGEQGDRGPRRWAAREGTPSPLGVTWVAAEQAYNFALYSKHAWGVTLLLYDDDLVVPLFSRSLNPLENKSGRVWHCRVSKAAAAGAKYYAYRVSGPPPTEAVDWHRFDPDKILLDPTPPRSSFRRASTARPRLSPAAMPARRRWGFCARARRASTGLVTGGRTTSRTRSSMSFTSGVHAEPTSACPKATAAPTAASSRRSRI